MNRIVRTGRQPGNGKNKHKTPQNKNNSFTMGHRKSYDDRSSESISDAASNNMMEIPQDDDDPYAVNSKKSKRKEDPRFGSP